MIERGLVYSSVIKQVGNVLLSVYMNETEPSNVRIGAFVVLRNTMPSLTTLQAIVHRLRTERSSQVRTFVYTTLVSLSKLKATDQGLSQLLVSLFYESPLILQHWGKRLVDNAAKTLSTDWYTSLSLIYLTVIAQASPWLFSQCRTRYIIFYITWDTIQLTCISLWSGVSKSAEYAWWH